MTKTCHICHLEEPHVTFSRKGNRSMFICDTCHAEGSGEISCPSCGKYRHLALSTLIEYARKPWFCPKCLASKRIDALRAKAIHCDRCGRWFIQTKRGVSMCGKCRCLAGTASKNCSWCGDLFDSARADKLFCSPRCRSRATRDKSYFGGNMRTAAGWDKKECQACFAILKPPRRFHIHHVFGHPDHSRLAVLCHSCHDIVTQLACKKVDIDALGRLLAFAWMQKTKTLSTATVKIIESQPENV